MKKPKLSDLILKGAALRPQCFGQSFTYDKRGFKRVISSCAIGAAYEAYYGEPGMATFWADEFYPEIDIAAVTDANDIDRMTREEIAEILKAGGL